jgi:hypothetical protein
MRALLIILCLLMGLTVIAQKDVQGTVSPQSEYDSARSQYIKRYRHHFFLWPVLKQRKLEFELLNLPSKEQNLAYKSNKPYSKAIYGPSEARDLQLNILGKKWGIDVIHQKYKGFYIVDPKVEIPINTPFPQRPDIETRNIGLSTNYTFNNKKFSFRSAYNFVERQLTSTGSFLMFASLNSFKVAADSSLVGYKYENVFGDDAKIYKIRTTILGIAPGYTYSVIHKGFFLNGTLAAGPAHNWLLYEVEGGKNNNDINFSAFVIARIAVGFNGDNFFGGLSFTNQGTNAKFDNIQLLSSNSTFKILFGYRFREVGFLKRRIWDIPASLLN